MPPSPVKYTDAYLLFVLCLACLLGVGFRAVTQAHDPAPPTASVELTKTVAEAGGPEGSTLAEELRARR